MPDPDFQFRGSRLAHPLNMTSQKNKLWSRRVTETSHALDLDEGVFSRADPRSIARSLKRSAEHSRRRKSNPFRSAMSMLNFYINRGGKNLSASQTKILERAKDELRKAFGSMLAAGRTR